MCFGRTLGGRELRKAEVGFMVDWPAEAKSRVAGSSLTWRRAERPPLASTRFD
jgi:hypothetical protein